MNPNFDVLAIKELIQTTSVVKVHVSENTNHKSATAPKHEANHEHLLNILQFMPRSFNRSLQLMSGLISNAGKNIRKLWSPNLRIIHPTSSFPKNDSLMRMINQDTIHGQFPPL